MAITVTTDTIVKIIVRSGTNSDRVNIILSQGELGYATDSKRLFIGDGLTAGGNPAGVKNFGNYGVAYTTVQAPVAQSGDFINDGTTLYTYNSATGWMPTSNNVAFDGSTILFNNQSNTWGVNTSLLSGGEGYAATLSGVATVIQSNSAAWNYGSNLCNMPSNSVIINNDNRYPGPGAAVQINQTGQFLGYTTGPIGAVSICGINGIQTGSGGSTIFNIDGTPLQDSINTVATNVATISSILTDIENQFNADIQLIDYNLPLINQTLRFPTKFYVESSFVYAVDTHKGTAGLSNMWQNVFANQGCDPLRLVVATTNRARVVRVDARVNYHVNNHADHIYTRLCTFPVALPTTSDKLNWGGVNGTFPLLKTPFTAYTPSTVPIRVLDVVAVGGTFSDQHNIPVTLYTTYVIPANTTVVFGLQHLISSSSRDKAGSFVEINGWSSGNYNDGINTTRNLVGFTGSGNINNYPTNLPTYVGWYAWGNNAAIVNGVAQYNGAPGSTTLHPQTEFGICNDNATSAFADSVDIVNGSYIFQSKFWGVKNTSVIAAVFLN